MKGARKARKTNKLKEQAKFTKAKQRFRRCLGRKCILLKDNHVEKDIFEFRINFSHHCSFVRY